MPLYALILHPLTVLWALDVPQLGLCVLAVLAFAGWAINRRLKG